MVLSRKGFGAGHYGQRDGANGLGAAAGEDGPVTDPLPAAGYSELLGQIAAEVRSTRLRALRAANAEVIALNWRIGRLILRRQAQEGWGARVITLLSHRAQ